MSERELRKAVVFTSIVGDIATKERVNAVRQALADDPDVVKLWMTFKDQEWIEVAGLKEWIQATFHVLLTDDGGWEWTE